MSKTYILPLTRNYVRNWTAVEAIRELLQNAIDYGHGKLNCQIDDDSITITSEGAKLEARTLLLGCTSKADDDESIGSFGEGYKIALLVLARENIKVDVFNHGVKWVPRIAPSDLYQGEEVLFIDEEIDELADAALVFSISGLPPKVIEKVKENTLHLQEDIGKFHRVLQGDILLDRPGKLYVNGLFVSDTGLEFGYNVKPAFLSLERDRQTVSNFNLKFLTKDMMFKTGLHGWVAELMEKGVEDLEYAQYGAPELVKEACYRAFVNKHPGAVIAKSQSELEALVKEGMTEVKIYPASYAETVSSHPEYASGAIKTAKVTPQLRLKGFLSTWSKDMNRKTKEAFRELIKESTSWK